MRIAPVLDENLELTSLPDGRKHWKDTDWLSIDWSQQDAWEKATRILHDRIYGRFLRVVPCIKKLEGAGFAIMALDCLLIETLHQFQNGWLETQQGRSIEAFRKSLQCTPEFRGAFNLHRAELFYSHIRNGILHQAEIKPPSTIVRKDNLVEDVDSGAGVQVNRDLFHQALVAAFDRYLRELRSEENLPPNRLKKLRHYCRVKMDFICRQPITYFAYGGKLTQVQLGNLGASPLGSATLRDWELGWEMGKDGKKRVTLRQSAGRSTLGALYHILAASFRKLEEYEKRYLRRTLPVVVDATGEDVWAQVYVSRK